MRRTNTTALFGELNARSIEMRGEVFLSGKGTVVEAPGERTRGNMQLSSIPSTPANETPRKPCRDSRDGGSWRDRLRPLCILGAWRYQSIDRLTTGRSTIILAHGQAFQHTCTHRHRHTPIPHHATHSWISLAPTPTMRKMRISVSCTPPQNKRRHAGRPSPAQDHHQSRHSISSVCGYMTAGTDVRHKLKRLDPSSGPREPLARVLESLPLFIVSFATLFRCQRIPRIRCTGNAPLPML